MPNGSRRPFEYTADDGQVYAMTLDESTYEIPALGFGQNIDPSQPEYAGLLAATATRPLSPRYFNLVGTDADGRQVKRRIFVGDNESAAWVNPQTFTIELLTVVGNTATPTTFTVSSAIGERRQFIAATDTGLIDGDVDQNVASGPQLPPS